MLLGGRGYRGQESNGPGVRPEVTGRFSELPQVVVLAGGDRLREVPIADLSPP